VRSLLQNLVKLFFSQLRYDPTISWAMHVVTINAQTVFKKPLEPLNNIIVTLSIWRNISEMPQLYSTLHGYYFKCPTVGELCPALGWVTNVPSILGLLGGRGQSFEDFVWKNPTDVGFGLVLLPTRIPNILIVHCTVTWFSSRMRCLHRLWLWLQDNRIWHMCSPHKSPYLYALFIQFWTILCAKSVHVSQQIVIKAKKI
jgi:hypothetical protein